MGFYLPWYVIEPATDCEYPLIDIFERFNLLAIKIEKTLCVEWSPANKECDNNGG